MKAAFKLIISFGLLYYFFITQGDSLSSLIQIKKPWLLVWGTLVFVSVTYIMTHRWLISMRRAGGVERVEVSFWKAYLFYCFAQFIGLFSLGYLGTDASRIIFGRRSGLPSLKLGKEILGERVISLIALASLPILFYLANLGRLASLGVVLLIVVLLIFMRGHELILSLGLAIFGHSIKLAFLFYAARDFGLLQESLPLFKNLSAALFVESLPISWQGLGVGQLSFRTAVDFEVGPKVYLLYLESKLFFKVLSGLYYFNASKELFSGK